MMDGTLFLAAGFDARPKRWQPESPTVTAGKPRVSLPRSSWLLARTISVLPPGDRDPGRALDADRPDLPKLTRPPRGHMKNESAADQYRGSMDRDPEWHKAFGSRKDLERPARAETVEAIWRIESARLVTGARG